MYTHICTMLVALSLLLPIVGAQELSDDDKRTVQQFIKDAWNEIGATGGTTKLRAGFDETNFVDYSVSGLAAGGLPAKDLAGLKKGIRKGLKSMIGKLMGTIGKTWTKGFYEVRPVKLERGDAICQVVVFEFGEEAINLFDFKLRRRGGEWKWIDLRDATNGTWMKTRMMGAIGLLVAKKITFADFAGYRAFGVAMGMGKHAEARAAYKRMAPALQDHLAVLPRCAIRMSRTSAWTTPCCSPTSTTTST